MVELREDLINSAVTFLKDSQVSSSSLAKKIEFLEKKDLTNDEIQKALKRAKEDLPAKVADIIKSASNVSNSSALSSSPPPPPVPTQPPTPFGYATYNAPPPVPQRDWRDYFVMATVTMGVGYGLYELARRYVLPLIVPPARTALDADKEVLETEFARAQAVLDQLQKDNEELKASEEARTKKVDQALEDLESVITQVKTQVEKRNEEMKLIKLQMESIKDEMPKALTKNTEKQQYSLNELLAELKSLKQLVTARVNPQTPTPPPVLPSSYDKGKVSGPSTESSPILTNTPTISVSTPNTNPPPLVSQVTSSSSAPSSSTSLASSSNTNSPSSQDDPSQSTKGIFASMPSISHSRSGIPAWQLAKSTDSVASDSK